MSLLSWRGNTVDSLLPINYIHPNANAIIKYDKKYDHTKIYFSKNDWNFIITGYYIIIKDSKIYKTHISVHYIGNDSHPNIGFARWYLFIVTGRRIELKEGRLYINHKRMIRNINVIKRYQIPKL